VSVIDHPRKRGELRIYMGAAAGVGKTYAMLGEAHRRLERGIDLVAGVVEAHGRREVAELAEGIEIVPPIPTSLAARTTNDGRTSRNSWTPASM